MSYKLINEEKNYLNLLKETIIPKKKEKPIQESEKQKDETSIENSENEE